jgi:hypothetical protein
MSSKPRLRILHLEDNPFDREFVQLALEEGGIKHQTTYAMTQTEFLTALDKGGFDVILSDSSLRGSMARRPWAWRWRNIPRFPLCS